MMDLGWKVLIPVSLGWFLLIATLNVARDRGWPILVVVLGGVAVMVIAAAMLSGAVDKARADRLAGAEDEGVDA